MIDEEKLREAFAALQARVAYLERASGLFASDEEMRGPRADPEVRFSPKAWHGANHVGRHFSACEPDFLDVLAEALAWSADNPKPGKEKYATYSRIDARRARTWARRLRSGWTPPEPAASGARPGSDARAPAPGRPGGGGRPTGRRPGASGTRPGAPPASAPEDATGAPFDDEVFGDDDFMTETA